MKKLILLSCLLAIFTSCNNNPRYTQDSEEIEIVKTAINDYDYQEWEKLISHYADTAQIFYNTRSKIFSPQELIVFHKNNDASFSTRAFEDENREYEMVEDNNGKTWVNFWGLWKGNLAANNKQIIIPVHITYQFIDNKIVKEYGYWNSAELQLELQKIEAEKIESEPEDDTEDIVEIEDIEDIEEVE
ncbi:nuclear transport factor 2 family protein [Formosa maritima]|uniref:Nuclear transport factor 2 family protein n=1 Tax=Formosa maritima TaxID=2592046 RepID=A0A5D0GER7_9FLAO|nr:nuclear transport factor 2 family protein [Formosa maritima]TYA57498.1 nuclear transport factor 2 family protein [Formosa maritima]